MQKTKAKIITALLLAALTATLIPLVNASLGNILINDTTVPQDLPITPVPAGGNITLHFGNVTFSGSQFYLLLSQDGLSQVSSGDIQYTPLFNVAVVMSVATITQVPGTTSFPGGWTVGDGWVNGSIPINIAGGLYYIKAFDGATTALAVSQSFTVAASLRIIPDAGGAGKSIIVSANAFPANSLVNFSYINQDTLAVTRFANLTQTNVLGQVNITMPAPDRMLAPGPGDAAPVTSIFTFVARQNGTTIDYTANYTETQRGIKQFGRPRVSSTVPGSLQNATGLYGNLTSFTSSVSVGVGNPLRIVGNFFYPGVVTARWDNSIDLSGSVTLGSLTATDAGTFNVTVTVPQTGLGTHNVTLIDAGLQVFVVFLTVEPSITISPISGPIGTTVTVNGFGFPASSGSTVYNVTITFGNPPTSTVRNSTLTDASGQFTTQFNIPSGSAGGANTVRATANDSIPTIRDATFTVTAAFTVNPTQFYANSSNTAVAATGTGFAASTSFFVAIDNVFSPFTNTTNGVMSSSTGSITFTFIGVGFQPGLHVVALYLGGSGSGSNAPIANATFNVLADPLTSDTGILTNINSTVTSIWNKTQIMNGEILQINGTVATILTRTGTIQTSLDAINATVISISGNVATIRTDVGIIKANVTTIAASITSISSGFATVNTNVGTLTTTVQSLSSTLSSVSGTVGTISTSVGSITTDLSAINTKVTSIQGSIATIQTDLGTLQGTVTTISNGVATIQTDIGELQADVSTLSTDVSNVPGQISIPIWVAVVLALIAALAAIASLLLVRRKIAG